MTERSWQIPLVSAAVLTFVAALQIHRLDDPDTWWHLAAGRLIWTSGSVPIVDSFSYTAAGMPWLNRQWLFELLLYGSWTWLGPAGPALFAGILFLGAYAIVWRVAARQLPPWAAGVVVILAACVAVERFTVRPEAATLCFLAGYLALLGSGPVTMARVAGLVGLQVLWANSHALSVVGIVPVGAMLLDRLIEGDRAQASRLLLALVSMAMAEAVTPFGIAGALYPLQLFGYISGADRLSETIIEHRATSLAAISPVAGAAWVVLLLVSVAAAVMALGRRAWAAILTALAFVVLGFLARRNVALAGIGVAPLLAVGLASPSAAVERRARWAPALLGMAVVIFAGAQTARVVYGSFYQQAKLTRTFGLGSSQLLYPRDAVADLGRVAPNARIFNDDILGGFLLWERPGTRVFFDGRLQVYPTDVYEQYQSVLDDPRNFPAIAERWGIDAVILQHPSPGRLEMAGVIGRQPGWRVTYVGAGGIVLVRTEASGPISGVEGPLEPAWTPGIAGTLERLVAPLRGGWEAATTYYQRGRAIHYLFGTSGYARARADFEEALRRRPDFTAARIGLRACGG